MENIIYFDNAATTFPKPPGVIEAVVAYMSRVGGNPGRSAHRLSLEAARIVFEAREKIASLFNIEDSCRVIFTSNATEAINLALFGTLNAGDNVVTTSMEHNAVMRPLRHLEKSRGVTVTVIQCRNDGLIDLEELSVALRKETRLIVVNHASNVTGTLQPIEEIGKLKGPVPLLVDAAQTAGALPVDVTKCNIDLMAFSGHKSLFGPTGTGGLYINPSLSLRPLKFGGTGSNSGREEMPELLPDMYECGTLNVAGIAGLSAGVGFIQNEGIERIRAHEMKLTTHLLRGLESVNRICISGPRDPLMQTSTVSFNMAGLSSSDVAGILDREHGILTRPGLHCAPVSHRTLGTYPDGSVRISMSYFNHEGEIDNLVEALRRLAGR